MGSRTLIYAVLRVAYTTTYILTTNKLIMAKARNPPTLCRINYSEDKSPTAVGLS